MKNKKVTFQKLVDFVNSQPDDRPINFSQNSFHENCGCLMVHYGKFVGVIGERCSFTSVVDYNGEELVKFDESCSNLVTNCVLYYSVSNYKELKDLVQKISENQTKQ
jgi:hypothetical protein